MELAQIEMTLEGMINVPIDFVNNQGGYIACFEKMMVVIWRFLVLPFISLLVLGMVCVVKLTIEYEVFPKLFNLIVIGYQTLSQSVQNKKLA